MYNCGASGTVGFWDGGNSAMVPSNIAGEY